jgi:tight adherence protein C
MFSDPVLTGTIVFLVVFAGITVAGFLWVVRGRSDQRKALSRLRGLQTTPAPSLASGHRPSSFWIGFLGLFGNARPGNQALLDSYRIQLLRAGYFHPSAPRLFAGAKFLSILLLTLSGVVAALWAQQRSLDWRKLALSGLLGCSTGILAPSWWLSAQVRKRLRLLRNAFPDALDMLVLCMEGGISFNAAIQRVTDELHTVHPVLGEEMNILQREIQLGLSAGDGLRKLAERCGLADVRDLALVVLQSERYGASVTKALRSYSDNFRQERRQQAEEMAQKTTVKILFPTLLCIFPAIFIVILGPAAFQIAALFSR